jgi:hypothetical protein
VRFPARPCMAMYACSGSMCHTVPSLAVGAVEACDEEGLVMRGMATL